MGGWVDSNKRQQLRQTNGCGTKRLGRVSPEVSKTWLSLKTCREFRSETKSNREPLWLLDLEHVIITVIFKRCFLNNQMKYRCTRKRMVMALITTAVIQSEVMGISVASKHPARSRSE